jgi:hypothetical protein
MARPKETARELYMDESTSELNSGVPRTRVRTEISQTDNKCLQLAALLFGGRSPRQRALRSQARFSSCCLRAEIPFPRKQRRVRRRHGSPQRQGGSVFDGKGEERRSVCQKPEIHKLDILADLQDKKGGERLTRVIDPFPQVA